MLRIFPLQGDATRGLAKPVPRWRWLRARQLRTTRHVAGGLMDALHWWRQGDVVTQGTALVLLAMSVASWVVIVWKLRLLRRAGADVAREESAASALAFPIVGGAQPRTVRIGVLHPVTGALAYSGQQCREGAQMAIEDINKAGGIKSLGGAPLLADRVRDLLQGAGVKFTDAPTRGLDHGSYIPLMCMYPDADVPVLQISMPSLDPAELLAVDRDLDHGEIMDKFE